MTNLDDIERCPMDDHCSICGGTTRLAITATYETDLGVFCATLCGLCISAGFAMPSLPALTVANRVAKHCEHLGIDLDEMAVALAADRSV